MNKIKKKDRTMDDVSSGYEEFMKDKKTKKNGKKIFEKTIKKSVTPRGSK